MKLQQYTLNAHTQPAQYYLTGVTLKYPHINIACNQTTDIRRLQPLDSVMY